MAAGGSAHESEAVRVDIVFGGVFFDPADARLDVLHHLERGEVGQGAGPNGENGVRPGAENLEDTRRLLVTDFSAVGMP